MLKLEIKLECQLSGLHKGGFLSKLRCSSYILISIFNTARIEYENSSVRLLKSSHCRTER